MARNKTARPSADDLAEIAAGKGSARDKAEAAMYRSKTKGRGQAKGTARRRHKKRGG